MFMLIGAICSLILAVGLVIFIALIQSAIEDVKDILDARSKRISRSK